MKQITIAIALTLLGLTSVLMADPRSGFEEGLRLYRNDDIGGAIQAWEGVLKQGEVSGSLLYNLGNANYRQGQIGRAILYYERALKLMPRDRDIESNLDLAHLATTDRIEPPVRLIIWNWIDYVRDYFSLPELARALGIAGILAVLLIFGYRIGPVSVRATARGLAIAVTAVFFLVGTWYIWRAVLDSQTYAIIMVDKTNVHSAPDNASQELFALHEGTKVQCGESLTDWVSIRLSDGRKGWMQAGDLEKI